MSLSFLETLTSFAREVRAWLEIRMHQSQAHIAGQRTYCEGIADALDSVCRSLVSDETDVVALCARLRTAFLSQRSTEILGSHVDRKEIQEVLGDALWIRRRAVWEVERLGGPLAPTDPRVVELRELAGFFRQHAAMLTQA